MTEEKILVVDDDQTTGKIVEMQLKKMGYSVVSIAKTGSEAFKFAKIHTPDLVLMDINLGKGMDGVEAASTLMTQYGIPVIYVTAYADDDTLERAKKTRPYGYINKPLRETDIRTTISLAFERIKNQETSNSSSTKGAVSRNSLSVIYNAKTEKYEKLNPEDKKYLKKLGFHSIEKVLPRGNIKNLNNCLKQKRPQLVNSKLGDKVLSWEYQYIENPEDTHHGNIRITITDITDHHLLIDENIQKASLSEVLDRLTSGIIFINENLKVFYTNRSAEKLLKANRGLKLKDGFLNCSAPETTADLHRLVLEESGNLLTLCKDDSSNPLYILVSPLHSRSENYGQDLPIAIVYVFETINDSERIEDVVRVLYNLSPTEARIAAKLVWTPQIEDVADSLGITYNTVRTHLKRIYTKTNTNRLSSLVHMIITGPAGFLIHSRES